MHTVLSHWVLYFILYCSLLRIQNESSFSMTSPYRVFYRPFFRLKKTAQHLIYSSNHNRLVKTFCAYVPILKFVFFIPQYPERIQRML